MTTIQSLVAAALLSTVAAVSFAQTPVAAKAASAAAPSTLATPVAASASKPAHHKKHAKVHQAAKPAPVTPAASAAK